MYDFKDDRPARYGVMPRYANDNSGIVWFDLPC